MLTIAGPSLCYRRVRFVSVFYRRWMLKNVESFEQTQNFQRTAACKRRRQMSVQGRIQDLKKEGAQGIFWRIRRQTGWTCTPCAPLDPVVATQSLYTLGECYSIVVHARRALLNRCTILLINHNRHIYITYRCITLPGEPLKTIQIKL